MTITNYPWTPPINPKDIPVGKYPVWNSELNKWEFKDLEKPPTVTI